MFVVPRPRMLVERVQFALVEQYNSGATDDRRGRAGAAGWIRSIRYAGVEVDMKHHRLTKENKWTEKINGMTDNPRLT